MSCNAMHVYTFAAVAETAKVGGGGLVHLLSRSVWVGQLTPAHSLKQKTYLDKITHGIPSCLRCIKPAVNGCLTTIRYTNVYTEYNARWPMCSKSFSISLPFSIFCEARPVNAGCLGAQNCLGITGPTHRQLQQHATATTNNELRSAPGSRIRNPV